MTEDELVAAESLTSQMLSLLTATVRGKLNILISGGAGSGKTTPQSESGSAWLRQSSGIPFSAQSATILPTIAQVVSISPSPATVAQRASERLPR